jgi:creatinine amidohydrolase
VTLQHETLFRLVEDVVHCLIDQGFVHVVLLNGHQGNAPTLGHLIRKVRRDRGVLVPVVSPLGFGLTPEISREIYGSATIGHGGEPMGSVMLYLFPDLVDVGGAEAWGAREFLGLPPVGLSGVLFEGSEVGLALNMEDVAPPSGSLSDPALASRERGQRIVEHAVARLVRFMGWFKGIDPYIGKA